MDYYLNYEGGRINFSLPSGWNVLPVRIVRQYPKYRMLKERLSVYLIVRSGLCALKSLVSQGWT